ncbi:hypothetical protein OG911_28045 [Streptomyces sp. NBC_00208]|uniref:hypothetical protein n=1 Tax=Streptomyces sp. NBC_00208 TaxID=2975681 RepID=UPI002E2C69D2|nr:hypothetical protein [Streptomyces sp. NBC_00208]
MAATVWVVAQVRSFTDEGWALDWDLGGVFTTEAKARAACNAPGDAMWSMQLDEPLGRPRVEPPGITYPAALNKK